VPDDDLLDDIETDEPDNQPGQSTAFRKQMKRLEEKAAKADEYAEKLAFYERLEAFAGAGIDLDEPMGQMLFQGYNGDSTPEAVMAEASRFGWTFEEVDDEDLDQGASVGSGGSMRDDLEDAYANATGQEDLNERIANVYRAHGETVASDQ